MIQRILFLFILSTSITASHASAIDYIHKENNLRCDKYKIANEQNACQEHTANINGVLSNEKMVNPTRHATVDEAKIMLKAVMGTMIIHQYTLYPHASSPFNKKSQLTPSILLSKHFEILLLTEEYANEQYRFLASSACHFIPNTGNKKLKNISIYTGISEKTLVDWFLETCRDHGMEVIVDEDDEAPAVYQTSATAPLATKQITATAAPLIVLPERSIFKPEIQDLAGSYDPHFRSVLFGPVEEHSLACYSHVFISTYNLEVQTSFSDNSKTRIGSRYATIARLPDINGRQRFVVFEPHTTIIIQRIQSDHTQSYNHMPTGKPIII